MQVDQLKELIINPLIFFFVLNYPSNPYPNLPPVPTQAQMEKISPQRLVSQSRPFATW